MKLLTLWIKEKNSLLREDFVLIVADMGTEKTSVRAGGCIKCKARHHTSLCDKPNATVTKEEDKENTPKVEKT